MPANISCLLLRFPPVKRTKSSLRRNAVLSCCLTIVIISPARAQIDKPRLMLNTGGPVGGIRSVGFSADSTRLYAAGSGKVVNVWELHRADDATRAIPAEPLRWEIARGLRGRIYTMDVAATGAVAIAGFSAREATGDVAVFDSGRQRLQNVLPRQRPDVPGPGPQSGHAQTVVSVDFSPSGRQMVTMSIDGEVRLWGNQGATSTILQPAGQVTDGRVQKAAFLDENRIAFPQPDPAQQGAWRMAITDATAPNRPPLVVPQPIFWFGIADLTVSSDGQSFAATDHLGEVTLFANGPALSPRPLNRPRPQQNGQVFRTVASMSYGPGGLLALTTTADANGMCWFELWEPNANPSRLVTELAVGRGNAAYATAFSPDGSLLALSRADRPTVMLVPVPGGGPITLDFERAMELGGRGRMPHGIQFVGTEGYRIAIASPPADGNQQAIDRVLFDLSELRRVPGDIPPESRPATATGWRLSAPATSPTGQQEIQLFAPGAGVPRCSAVLETAQQGNYLSHTWLTDENGQVYGVAIATSRMDGIFLYDLPPTGRCRLLRYLRDHSDTINGLSVSPDGRYLVSSSEDQTVKVWSLAGLRNVNRTFPREDAWGATFAIENNQLIVKTALGAGIAFHRDLQVGDVITQAIYVGPGGVVTQNNPQAMLQALAGTPLWQTLRLSTVRNGQPRDEDIVVTPAWEPLATLFLDHNDEWALWTPQGVYDASAGGDELFGWQLNVGRAQDPQFFRAEKFRRELEQPDVMRQLLAAGSLLDAQLALNAAAARPIPNIAADIPQVRIVSPQMGQHFAAGQMMTVQAAVTYPTGTQPDAYRIRLFVNQIDGGEPGDTNILGGESISTWTLPPAADQNRILVRIEEAGGAVNALFQDAIVQVTAEAAPGQMRMHLFAVAAESYQGVLHQPFCNDDAHGLADLLTSHMGRQYEIGEFELITDEAGPEAVSKGTVEQKIAAFRDRLKDVPPDDLLVVFLAGHGRAFGEEYFFIPPAEGLENAPNDAAMEAVIRDVGISWDKLRSLAEIPCRKVYLLDTCHSGNVAMAEKSSLRPLKQMQAMIFSATSENQEALGQHPDRDNGLFTGYLIEGCSGKADGVPAYDPVNPKYVPSRDGRINLVELVSYVSHNVRDFNKFQRPKYTPIELLNFVDLPLFAVGAP